MNVICTIIGVLIFLSVAGAILEIFAMLVGLLFAGLARAFAWLFSPASPIANSSKLDVHHVYKPKILALPPAPTPLVPPRLKLEFLVEVGPTVGVAPSLLLKVRGGPLVADTVRLVYVVTGSFTENGRSYDLGESSSISDPPAPFRGVFQLPQQLDNSNDWILLRTIYQDAIIPPRRGVQSCQFSCQVFLRGGEDVFGTPRAIGSALQTATFSVSLDFNCLGYLDEREWVSLRVDGLALLLVILDGCEVEKPSKSQKLKAWVQGLALPSKSTERQRAITQRLFDQYLNGLSSGIVPNLVRQHEVIGELSRCKDYEFQRKVALLAVQLVGGESKHGLGRSLCAKITDAFSGALYSLPRQDLEPAPPLAPVPAVQTIPTQAIPPVPVVPPAPSPAVTPVILPPAVVIRTPLVLRVKPILEKGLAKGVEVFVQGAAVDDHSVTRELHFWLLDTSDIDEQHFLVAQADINEIQVPFRMAFTWVGGKYDPKQWNSAGRVLFGQALPPIGGGRSIVAVGCLSVVSTSSADLMRLDIRSEKCGLSIGVPGYLKLRDLRLNIRKQAFRLALGFATLAGKGTTHPQDNILSAYIDWIAGECMVASEKDRTKQVLHDMLGGQKELMFKGPRALASWKRLATQFSKQSDASLQLELAKVLDRLIDGRKALLPGSYELYNHCLDAFGLGHLPRRG